MAGLVFGESIDEHESFLVHFIMDQLVLPNISYAVSQRDGSENRGPCGDSDDDAENAKYAVMEVIVPDDEANRLGPPGSERLKRRMETVGSARCR